MSIQVVALLVAIWTCLMSTFVAFAVIAETIEERNRWPKS